MPGMDRIGVPHNTVGIMLCVYAPTNTQTAPQSILPYLQKPVKKTVKITAASRAFWAKNEAL